MERPAKERLIGAVVIVTVAWLLIPVFLDEGGGDDGAVVARQLALPDPDDPAGAEGAAPMRRETVALTEPEAGQGPEAAAEPVPVTTLPVPGDARGAGGAGASSEATPGEPEPAASSTALPPPEPQPEPPSEPAAAAQAATAATDEAVAQADGAPESDAPAGQLWAVQLGSFSDRDNAQRLAGELRAQGLPAFLSQVESGGRTLHRVRVGPQASREAATAVAERLVASGQATASVVRHP